MSSCLGMRQVTCAALPCTRPFIAMHFLDGRRVHKSASSRAVQGCRAARNIITASVFSTAERSSTSAVDALEANVLLQHATHSPADTSISNALCPSGTALLAWLQECGAYIHPALVVVLSAPCGSRGIITTVALPEGTVLFKVRLCAWVIKYGSRVSHLVHQQVSSDHSPCPACDEALHTEHVSTCLKNCAHN